MAAFTTYMTLKVFNLAADLYDYNAVANNWALLDQHDHSQGKGTLINAAGLAAGSVTQAKIAAGAVGTSQIANQAVTQPQIGNGAVGAAQIAGGSIGAAQLAPGLSLPTTGAAGGDLTGNYPNPTVALIGGQAPVTTSTSFTGDVTGTATSTNVSRINSSWPTNQLLRTGIINSNGSVSTANTREVSMGWLHIQVDGAANIKFGTALHGLPNAPSFVFTSFGGSLPANASIWPSLSTSTSGSDTLVIIVYPLNSPVWSFYNFTISWLAFT